MNIRLDGTGSVQVNEEIENKYSTYTKNSIRGNANKIMPGHETALSMRLGDVMSDTGMNAYGADSEAKTNDLKTKLSMQDQHKNYMVVMSNTVSDKDLARLNEEGYNVDDMEPEEIVTIVDEIKANLAKAGTIIPGYNDDVSEAALSEVGVSKVQASQIQSNADVINNAIDNYDLPDTKENREALDETGNTASKLTELDEGSMKYMLRNKLEPTIDNLYMAEHSGSKDGKGDATGYYSNDGYYSKKADDKDIDNLLPRIKEIIENAGYTPDEEAVADAKWMIENGLELTEETFRNMQKLQSVPLPVSFEQGVNAAAASIKNTGNAKNAIPGQYKTVEEIASEKIDELNGLIESQEPDESPRQDGAKFQELSYRRQLEETRLIMTISNTSFLIRNDININFDNLQELVDNLKVAENTIRENMFHMGSVEANDRAAEVFEHATKVVNELPSLPASTLALFEERELTLDNVYNEGNSLKNQYAKAGQSYETLMTEVRSDLGDSIQKAFGRMDSLLTENGIEVNEANEKAARILGYNEMAITSENIDRVRDADEKLQRVIGKMTPAATLSLIRDGINPVTLDIDELEARLNERQNDAEKEIERYNSFLVKLDDNGEISPEEREGYIGIYRMIHQIESKDSAAIGALLEQGGEMTLGNLLTQVRNRKASGRVAEIDDSFGLLDKTIKKKSSITEQIENAFSTAATKPVLTEEEIKEARAKERDANVERIIQEARESINEASNAKDDVQQLLDIGDLPAKMVNVKGAKALIKDRGMLLRAKRRSDEVRVRDESFANKDAEDKLLEDIKSLPAKFTDEQTAKKAYEEMASQMEDNLNENVFNISDRKVIKDIKAAIGALGVARSLARNEHYEIPMEIGGEESSVSVHLVHGSGNESQVRIYTDTESRGRISAIFTAKNGGLEGLIESDRKTTITDMQNKLNNFTQRMSEKNISITNMFFSQNINAGLAPLSKNGAPGEKADTADLYQAAKGFLEVMAG